MAKKINLQIPEPCHENWKEMTLVEKGRFCGSCQKEVMDFTNMSDQQIMAFFRKPTTSAVCGRFQDDQLNRDIALPKKRIPWVKYFFQFALPAFLLSMKTTAQAQKGKVKVESTPHRTMGMVAPVCTKEVKGDTLIESVAEEMTKISGKIIDEKGNAIPHASVTIKGTRNGAISNGNGNFTLISREISKATLIVSSVGYNVAEVFVNNRSLIKIVLLPHQKIVSGEVMIIGFIQPKPQKRIPLINRIFKDTAFSKFKVNPNPVLSGSTITIEWKGREIGDHLLELFNQSGQVMWRQQIKIEKRINQQNIQIPFVAPGAYFLSITNKETGKVYSEKVIIK